MTLFYRPRIAKRKKNGIKPHTKKINPVSTPSIVLNPLLNEVNIPMTILINVIAIVENTKPFLQKLYHFRNLDSCSLIKLLKQP